MLKPFIPFKGFSEDQKREMVRLMAKNCMKQEKATDADLDELVKRDLPTTPTSKCLRACIMESLNLVNYPKRFDDFLAKQ